MPNKKKAQDGVKEGKKGHGILNTIIVLMILIFWLAIFAIFIKLDFGGLGTMLRPMIGNVPIINQILPDQSEAEIAEENDYPYSSLAEAIARIKELEAQLADVQSSKDDSLSTITQLQAEIDRLKEFEDNQLEFEARVEAFDENVVFAEEAPDIDEYKQYYEEINPDHAAEIYEKVIKQLQYDEAIQEKAEIFKKMKAKDAAAILEEMTADTGYVAKILLSMEPKYSGLILAEMDRTNAAKITKKMLDLDAEILSQIQ